MNKDLSDPAILSFIGMLDNAFGSLMIPREFTLRSTMRLSIRRLSRQKTLRFAQKKVAEALDLIEGDPMSPLVMAGIRFLTLLIEAELRHDQ